MTTNILAMAELAYKLGLELPTGFTVAIGEPERGFFTFTVHMPWWRYPEWLLWRFAESENFIRFTRPEDTGYCLDYKLRFQ